VKKHLQNGSNKPALKKSTFFKAQKKSFKPNFYLSVALLGWTHKAKLKLM